MLKKPWIIDEKILFAPSKQLKIQKIKIGAHKGIIIDNFYENPEQVQDLILRSPASTWKGILHGYTGARHQFSLDLSPIYLPLSKIIQVEFQSAVNPNPPLFQSNIIIQDPKKGAGPCSQPHTDEANFAFSIFLTPPEECLGGTAFYRHKKTGLQLFPITKACQQKRATLMKDTLKKHQLKNQEELTTIIYKDKSKESSFVADSNEDWELVQILEMKFNRLILHEADLFHSAYIEPSFYLESYRISQVGFII